MTITDAISALTALGKNLVSLAAGEVKIAAQELILRYQALLSDLIDENHTLRRRNQELQDQLELKAAMIWRDGAFWSAPPGGGEPEPFCPRCFGDAEKAIHLVERRYTHTAPLLVCPNCGFSMDSPPNRG